MSEVTEVSSSNFCAVMIVSYSYRLRFF